MGDTTAWLMLAVEIEDRSRASNDGYDDDPSSYYSWDNTVANYTRPRRGDVIVLWDKDRLLGASVIEEIKRGRDMKDLYRCTNPDCTKSKVEFRKRMRPPIKCYTCKTEYERDELPPIPTEVETYRTHHSTAWVDLADRLTGSQLRQLCVTPASINSIRELDYDRFREAIREAPTPTTLTSLDAAVEYVASGHARAFVRVRRGQSAFRGKLLAKYGNECAFTGPAPADALEAAHLYSYAKTGVHHNDGGFLMRRDLHRLFDLGFLAVNPDSLLLDVRTDIRHFEDYGRLHGKKLVPEPTRAQLKWLRKHWEQVRPTSPEAA